MGRKSKAKANKSTLPNPVAIVDSSSKNQKRLKYYSGLFLLLSFLSQTFLLEYWSSNEDKFKTALNGYAIAYNNSLAHLNLFFTSSSATEKIQNSFIKKAAEEDALGRSMMITVFDLPKKQKAEKIKKILSLASSVNDLDSYNIYIEQINTFIGNNLKETEERIATINKWRSRSFWVYGILYVIGALLAIISVKYDR